MHASMETELNNVRDAMTFITHLNLVAESPRVVLSAGVTPGYGDEVIFADGTFIDGSTAELSADGPLREPFVVYTQGGTHWTHWAYVLEEVLSNLRSAL